MGKKSKRKSVKQKSSPKAPSEGVASIDNNATPKLKVDDRVTLRNLDANEYNGKVGTVKYMPRAPVNTDSRYGVLLDGAQKAIGVQAKNLEQLFKIGDRVSFRGLASKDYNGLVKLPESAENPRYGVQLEVDDKAIGVRPSNMFPANRMTTQEQKTALDRLTRHAERSEEDCMNADQMAMMRTMMNMFLTEEKQIEVYGRRIDPLAGFSSRGFQGGATKRNQSLLGRRIPSSRFRTGQRLAPQHGVGAEEQRIRARALRLMEAARNQ